MTPKGGLLVSVMDPIHGELTVPKWVVDLRSFTKWYHSGVLPEKVKVHYIQGRVWFDLFMEEFFSHNQVKAALGHTLGGLIRDEKLGWFVPDGMLLKNESADIGTEPDAMFVSRETRTSGRVTFTAGFRRGAQATCLVGSPDLVVEIVSHSSVDKDEEWLMSAYHNAGVREYWVIDARRSRIRFDIFKHGPKGYVEARKTDGWVKSAVLARSFRLTRDDSDEMTAYALEVR